MRFALLICDGWGMRFAGTLRGTFELRSFFRFFRYLVGDLRTQNSLSLFQVPCGGLSSSVSRSCGGPSNSERDLILWGTFELSTGYCLRGTFELCTLVLEASGGPSRSPGKANGGPSRSSPARLVGDRHAPPLFQLDLSLSFFQGVCH
jgi:hypothetical protein